MNHRVNPPAGARTVLPIDEIDDDVELPGDPLPGAGRGGPLGGADPDALGQSAPNVVLPALTVHMFLQTADTVAAMRRAQRSNAFSRLKWLHKEGGLPAALANYRTERSPDLLIIECNMPRQQVYRALTDLAEMCRAETRVLFISGAADADVSFYRDLMKLGVSDLLTVPLDPGRVVNAIKDIFADASDVKLGHSTAFIGAGGGTGSSTIAQNVAVAMSRLMSTDVILADMDPQFGTVALNFDIWDAYTLTDVLRRRSPVDEQLLERILKKVNDRLGLILVEPGVDNLPSLPSGAVNAILNLTNTTARHVVLDMPYVWGLRTKKTLARVDNVVVTAMPTLAGLQACINLFETLRRIRPGAADPILVLNKTGLPRRIEVSAAEFREALGVPALIEIPFMARQFSRTQGAGMALVQQDPDGPIARRILQIARRINGDLDHGDSRSRLDRIRDLLRRWW